MSIVDKIAAKFDGEKTMTFNEVDPFDTAASWISTGSPTLDRNLKTFGWPTGIVEVRGESQSGKTTLSLNAMLQAQRQHDEDAIITILSSERRDNKAYAEQMGVDTEEILVHKVITIEDVRNKIFQTITATREAIEEDVLEDVLLDNDDLSKNSDKTKELVREALLERKSPHYLFVWDALGQTVSAQELAKAKDNAEKNKTDKAALGSASRALAETFRAFIGLTDEENITLFIVNRPYDSVDGRGKKSYGGKAITLYPTMRIELIRTESLKINDTEEIGQVTLVHVLKSDFDKPKQKFNVEIGYGYGMVLNAEDVKFGIEKDILEKHYFGAKFTLGTKTMEWRSRRDLYALYEEQHELLPILISRLIKAAHEDVAEMRGLNKDD